MLSQWLYDTYGARLAATSAGLEGAPLADAVLRALQHAGVGYDLQRAALCAAPLHHCDHRFGMACLDHAEQIARFQRRLADTPVPACAPRARRRSVVTARTDRPPAEPTATHRFLAAEPDNPDLPAIVADLCRALVARGYVGPAPDAERDLRQGLGYFLRAEDPLRPRATLRWMHRQNELAHLVLRLLDDPRPLCLVDPRRAGRWEVAASLFADDHGRRLENLNLCHARLGPGPARSALDALIPRLPARI